MKPDARPLVVHVLFRFGVGGLENGVANLVNRMDRDQWRHAIVALDRVEPAMRARIESTDVRFVELHKPPGHLLRMYPRLWRIFRELRPAVVHTRNLAALEAAVPAAWAQVPVRIHGEHGWDMHDPEGRSARYRLVRRMFKPWVHQYVALSQQIQHYLTDGVGVAPSRISQIYNGVDTRAFAARAERREPIAAAPFDERHWVVGTVGRLQPVKDQALLLHALAHAFREEPAARSRMRVAIIGDGPLRADLEALARTLGIADAAWFAGERAEVAMLLRGFDVFALPSLSEGISNTILEAMAAGLPVVATRVGGNGELIEEGVTGRLVPSGDAVRLAHALLAEFRDPVGARQRGYRGRLRAEQRFSLDAMLRGYERLYVEQLARRGAAHTYLHEA